MVAYLKRSMREPKKLRKLLCRLMWLSSSSLILPKTYGREKKGSVIQARARQPGKQLHVHLGSWAHTPVLQGLILPQVHHSPHSWPPKQLTSTLSVQSPWKSTPGNICQCTASMPRSWR